MLDRLLQRLALLPHWFHAHRGAFAGFGCGVGGSLLLMLFAAAVFQGGLSDSAPPPPQAIFIPLDD